MEKYLSPPVKFFVQCAVYFGFFCAGLLSAQSSLGTTAAAALTIGGDLPSPITLSLEDLRTMPRQSVSVADQDGTQVSYEGVTLRDVLNRAGAPFGKDLRGKSLASYIVAKARDGYEVVFTLAELDAAFANESIVVADRRDGKALFQYQGPLRLVCAHDKAGARSVRMLKEIDLVRLQK